jgi:hypothetical protein
LAAVTALVRRYYSLLNGSTSLANANALARLMTPDCTCQEVVQSTRSAVAKGQQFFGSNRVLSVVPSLDGPAAADVVVTYDYTRSGVKDRTGHVISSGRGRNGTTQDFRLVKRNNAWLINAILRVSPGAPA